MDYIGALERALGITANMNMMEMQPGDASHQRDTTALRDCWFCT